MKSLLLDAAGHRRSPATLPGYHQGRVPRNKWLRYLADPPTIEEVIAVMRKRVRVGGTVASVAKHSVMSVEVV